MPRYFRNVSSNRALDCASGSTLGFGASLEAMKDFANADAGPEEDCAADDDASAGAPLPEEVEPSTRAGFKKLAWYELMLVCTKASTSLTCCGVHIHASCLNGAAKSSVRSAIGSASNFFHMSSMAGRPEIRLAFALSVPRNIGTKQVKKCPQRPRTCRLHDDIVCPVCSDGACILSKLLNE